MAAIERAGTRYLKSCGLPIKSPPSVEALLNNTENAGVLALVVDELLTAGGNKDYDLDELLESYVEHVDDIPALRREINQAYNRTLAPRAARKRADEAERMAEENAKNEGHAATPAE